MSSKRENRYDRAKAFLQVSNVPPNLPCREEQRRLIRDFILDAVNGGSKRTMYICGVPGTGKTAVVSSVVRELVDFGQTVCFHQFSCLTAVQKGHQLFRPIFLNAMSLSGPHHAYCIINKVITGRRESPKRSLRSLSEWFLDGARPGSIFELIICDELDFLITRKQHVLYNLFNWPVQPDSRVVVIGIANTMDLHERLVPKVASRLGLNRVIFSPYGKSELCKIIENRLEGLKVFQPSAIGLCAAKVAAVSGDARRALEICRRAADMAEDEWKETGGDPVCVNVDHISHAIEEMTRSVSVMAIRSASLCQKVLILSLMIHMRRTGGIEVPVYTVIDRAIDICQMSDLPSIGADELSVSVDELHDQGIFVFHGPVGTRRKVRLFSDDDEVRIALEDDSLLGRLVRSAFGVSPN